MSLVGSTTRTATTPTWRRSGREAAGGMGVSRPGGGLTGANAMRRAAAHGGARRCVPFLAFGGGAPTSSKGYTFRGRAVDHAQGVGATHTQFGHAQRTCAAAGPPHCGVRMVTYVRYCLICGVRAKWHSIAHMFVFPPRALLLRRFMRYRLSRRE
eukprot:439252-Prymnesium_polylepis.1